MEETKKEKAGSAKPRTMEAAGVSKDDQPAQAAVEAGLERHSSIKYKIIAHYLVYTYIKVCNRL